MGDTLRHLLDAAAEFVQLSSFPLAYGILAKVWEKEHSTPDPKLQVLTRLLDFAKHIYENQKFYNHISNQIFRSPTLVGIMSCAFCKSLLFEPSVLACGHVFCRPCVDGNFICHFCPAVTSACVYNECNVLANILEMVQPDYKQHNSQLKRIRRLLAERKYEDVVDAYNQLIQSNSESYRFLYGKAEICFHLGNIEETDSLLDKILELEKDWSEAYSLKGMVLNRMNKPREAIEYLFKAYTMYPYNQRVKTEIYSIFDDLFTSEDIEILKNVSIRIFGETNISHIHQQLEENVKSLVPILFWMNASQRSTQAASSACLMTSRFKADEPVSSESFRSNLINEFKCHICKEILVYPLTPFCGHTFCKECIERSIDWRQKCPLCNASLCKYLSLPSRGVNTTIHELTTYFFPNEVRQRQLDYKTRQLQLSKIGKEPGYRIPVIISRLVVPGFTWHLQIAPNHEKTFVRQALESGSRRIASFKHGSLQAVERIGVMLKINEMQMSHDGPYLVEASGFIRIQMLKLFKVGDTIEITYEPYDDLPVNRNQSESYELECLQIYDLALKWQSLLNPEKKSSIYRFFGALPPTKATYSNCLPNEPPLWIWWLVAVLPLSESMKYTLISCRDPLVRLDTLRSHLQRFIHNRLIRQSQQTSQAEHLV